MELVMDSSVDDSPPMEAEQEDDQETVGIHPHR